MKKDFLELILMKNLKMELEQVIACNQYTQKFGVVLSMEEGKELMECRKEALKTQERLELGEGILAKLIYEFCDSPYLYQDNYAESLGELQRIFYLYKNESLDELSDDELIHFMKQKFDGECEGSLGYLEDTVLDEFCRSIREMEHGFIGGKTDV